ncbi:MAG: alpha/beta fold hydrolase [Clostridia bacterium]|nr:alpha/beta fold hydrolase [Clostridia bacterium]
MEIKTSEWYGFKRIDFKFNSRECILIFPSNPTQDKKWLYKTEYFDAFPQMEIEMLKKGYCVAHMQNTTRMCPEIDTDMRPLFCEFLINEFGLNSKCALVGMSCGGMQAVYFAAKYPQYVSCIYLDAPVMNYLSWPFALGIGENDSSKEFIENMGMGLSQMLSFRNHPIDQKEKLLKTGIPIMLVSGDSDTVVPFCENGQLLWDYYRENDAHIEVIIKKGGDHHPHGLPDNTPIVEFIQKHY